MIHPGIGPRRRGAPTPIRSAMLSLALVACAAVPETTPVHAPRDPVDEPTTGRPTFSVDGLADAPLCADAHPHTGSLAPVALRLIRGPGVSTPDTRVVGETIRMVWDRLGLSIVLTDPEPLPASTPDRLFDPGAPTEAAQLAPMRAVLDALPTGSTIAVVVMPQFVDHPSPLSAFRGLTVPVRGSTEASASTSTAFVESNPHPFPVVFVNLAAGPRAPGDLSLAPAHEVGHALGLAHRSKDATLMSGGDLSVRCLAGLSDPEWQTLTAAAERPPTEP